MSDKPQLEIMDSDTGIFKRIPSGLEDYIEYEDLLEFFQESCTADAPTIGNLYSLIGQVATAVNYHRYPDDWVGSVSIAWNPKTKHVQIHDDAGHAGIYHSGVIYPSGAKIWDEDDDLPPFEYGCPS